MSIYGSTIDKVLTKPHVMTARKSSPDRGMQVGSEGHRILIESYELRKKEPDANGRIVFNDVRLIGSVPLFFYAGEMGVPYDV